MTPAKDLDSLAALNADLLRYLHSHHLAQTDGVLLRLVNKRLAQVFSTEKGSDKTKAALDSAARRGHFGQLQWLLHACRSKLDQDTFAAAAEGGHMVVINWLADHRCPFDSRTSIAAARHGHIPVLKWCVARGMKFTSGELYETVYGNQLAALKWIWPHYGPNGHGWDTDCAYTASRLGNVKMLRWLAKHGYPWEETDCVRKAADSGQLAAVIWLLDSGHTATKGCACAAARSGHLDVVKYLAEKHGLWQIPTVWSETNPRGVAEVKAYLSSFASQSGVANLAT